MTHDRQHDALAREVRSVVLALLPGATVMDLPSVVSADAVALTAFTSDSASGTADLLGALRDRLLSAGWLLVDEQRAGPTEEPPAAVRAELIGVGQGVFAVEKGAVSFNEVPGDV